MIAYLPAKPSQDEDLQQFLWDENLQSSAQGLRWVNKNQQQRLLLLLPLLMLLAGRERINAVNGRDDAAEPHMGSLQQQQRIQGKRPTEAQSTNAA